MPRVNWADTHTFTAPRFHRPASVSDLQWIVSGSVRARALGTGHSFNAIADTDGDLISLADLPPTIEVDSAAASVKVSAGVRYGELAGELNRQGYALANLGSLPHISVAGACATGTHGSGDANTVLAGSVRGLDIVTAEGDLVTIDGAHAEQVLPGAVIALGALGIVTGLTLAIEPTYQVRQDVYAGLPFAAVREHFDAITGAGYSVSIFTSWQGDAVDMVWVKSRADRPAGEVDLREYGAVAATEPRNPVPGMSAGNCTGQLGVPGPWHERLPHFRLDFTPSSGEEIQSEYLLPRQHAVAALDAINDLGPRISPLLQISEIRTVAADDLWLSPAYARDSVAIHFTLVRDMLAVLPLLAEVERALQPFDARPHWGKVFTTQPDIVGALYPRLADFEQLRATLDPDGMFGNEFVDRYVG